MNEAEYMNQPSDDEKKEITLPAKERKDHRQYLKYMLPLLLVLLTAGVAFLPKTAPPKDGTTIKTLNVRGFPLTLVLEQNDGTIKSAWLRTPAGTREIGNLNGLTYLSEGAYITSAAQGGKEDLLWRTSYINFEDGKGLHLWIGIAAGTPKVYISTTPYSYTKWDNIPAKLVVPKGTAVYISPAIPSYNSKDVLHGKDNYSFVYTVRMTPEGPTFVPVPDVYRQLAVLLRVGMQDEYSAIRRLAYARMLEEFNKLSEGNPPNAETLLNFQMNRIDTLSW